MIEIEAIPGSIAEFRADLIVANRFQDTPALGGGSKAVDQALGSLLSQALADEGFEGKVGEALHLHSLERLPARGVLVLGLGPQEEFGLETVRKVGATLLRQGEAHRARTVGTILHGAGAGGLTPGEAAQALAEGILLASHRFDKYQSKREERHPVEKVSVVERDEARVHEISQGLRRGALFSRATIIARELTDEPPASLPPRRLAERAESFAKEVNLDIEVLDEKALERQGFRAVLAVGQGSAAPPCFIHLKYRPGKESRPRVVLVGKGITFDSGGLNLKPAKYMENMKCDKAGAAAVLGTLWALPQLGLRFAVDGMVAAAENMPGAGAYKLGDVVETFSGKTVEITHTDAEGRVTLADVLAYAALQQPEEIIELSTLTGACVVALGASVAGVMGSDGPVERLLEASRRSGEFLWRLPLYPDYQEYLKSQVADLRNSSAKSDAGAIVAGLFLAEFVGEIPWAHLDIAGPAWRDEEPKFYWPKGGTGVGVRTLLQYLEMLS